jgi:hypothetical protein
MGAALRASIFCGTRPSLASKTLRVILSILYSVFVERGLDDKFVIEHHALPPEAEKTNTAGVYAET